MDTTKMASRLLSLHSNSCGVSGKDFWAGVKYVPEFSYEFDEKLGETVFNQAFHDLMLRIGIVDSTQSPEERGALGQALVIPTKELMKYCEETGKQ